MTDKERRQERIKEMHDRFISELIDIVKYRDFNAARYQENALYYAIGFLVGGGNGGGQKNE